MQLIPIIKHGGLVDYWVRKVKETLRAGGEDIHYHSGTYLKTDVERHIDVSILTWYLLDSLMEVDLTETEMTVTIRFIAQYLGKLNCCSYFLFNNTLSLVFKNRLTASIRLMAKYIVYY